MSRKFFIIILITLICVSIFSCTMTVIESEPQKVIDVYFGDLVSKNYKNAYEKLDPTFRENSSFDNYVKNIQQAELENGNITAVKVENLKVVDERSYIYEIIVATTKKYIKYNVELRKINDIWYINAVKPIAYKDK